MQFVIVMCFCVHLTYQAHKLIQNWLKYKNMVITRVPNSTELEQSFISNIKCMYIIYPTMIFLAKVITVVSGGETLFKLTQHKSNFSFSL